MLIAAVADDLMLTVTIVSEGQSTWDVKLLCAANLAAFRNRLSGAMRDTLALGLATSERFTSSLEALPRVPIFAHRRCTSRGLEPTTERGSWTRGTRRRRVEIDLQLGRHCRGSRCLRTLRFDVSNGSSKVDLKICVEDRYSFATRLGFDDQQSRDNRVVANLDEVALRQSREVSECLFEARKE